jgi:hypothetical protein
MRAVRHWSIRHARSLMRLYDTFEGAIVALEPVARRIGYKRLEAPVAALERTIKGAMFDCQMCGQCALSSTGMSCPMNCPKNLRNGPCGGVRANGMCEVKPDMPCVWVKAWDGNRAMADDRILDVQRPVDHRLKGHSSWLKVMRELAEGPRVRPATSARHVAGSAPR